QLELIGLETKRACERCSRKRIVEPGLHRKWVSSVNNMRTLLWVNDSLSPYRVHLLRAVNRELTARDIRLKLYLMAPKLRGRPWNHETSELGFPSRVFSGVQPRYDMMNFHFNPGLVLTAARERAEWLLVAGGWYAPTSFLTLFASALMQRSRPVIFWVEANRESMSHRHALAMNWRRSVLKVATALAVPGQVAVDTIVKVVGIREKPFLRLPNIVDEVRYGATVETLRRDRESLRRGLGLSPDERVFFWPARLHELHKGIINFLGAVKDLIGPDVRIVIAGEGPDRAMIERHLATWGLSRARLVGQQSADQMIEWLAAADALLLPSLSDPNPLSVVEALWAGLPLLISNRCGNWPEAVSHTGQNGWVVDPGSVTSMRTAFAELVSANDEQRAAMGTASREMALTRFSTERCVREFVDQLEGCTVTGEHAPW
ncbi:MAG: glycosyltransferase family 4 protein, partial [Gemmatimonadota bacterium]